MRSMYLEPVRKLLFEGKYEEAGKLSNEGMGRKWRYKGKPTREDSYQPAGDLTFSVGTLDDSEGAIADAKAEVSDYKGT